MIIFKSLVYLFAVIAIVTGAADLLNGAGAQFPLETNFTEIGVDIAALDTIFRFFSGLWLGVGILFVLFAQDLVRYRVPMIALLGVIIIGGLGRVMSLVQFGLSDQQPAGAITIVGLVIELLVCPLMIAWLIARKKPEEA